MRRSPVKAAKEYSRPANLMAEYKAQAKEGQKYMSKAPIKPKDYIEKCQKCVKACGHTCNGVHGEESCLPCLDPDCRALCQQNCEDTCTICFDKDLKEEACVQLLCGHVFHANCMLKHLKQKWKTLNINFSYLACPTCKQEIMETKCEAIKKELAESKSLKRKVEKMALEQAEIHGVFTGKLLKSFGDNFEAKLRSHAMQACAFYECSDCKEPYFGGIVDPQSQLYSRKYTKKENQLCSECKLKAGRARVGQW